MLRSIKISDCLHYRGYRYGGYKNNIYEDYIIGLANEDNLFDLRQQFLRRVLAYQAKDFGQALNLSLKKNYEPWRFPWNSKLKGNKRFPVYTPIENPDVICHVCPTGVLSSHINREYFWLERAYVAMKSSYEPHRYGYINVMPLKGEASERFIVLDGNHRLSALHALGENTIMAKVANVGLKRRFLAPVWPNVMSREFCLSDALKIFDRYFFDSNQNINEDIVQTLILDEPLITHDRRLI